MTPKISLIYKLLIAAILVVAVGLFIVLRSHTRPNVILIVLDTLRADHLGIYGYERNTSPVLDSLAKETWIARYAISPAPWTPPAVSSMFTGLYATSHGMMPPDGRELALKNSAVLAESNLTLAEIFKSAGYQTIGVTPNPWIKEDFGFSQGFEQYFYRHRVRAEEINKAAFKVLDGMDKNRPFFLFLHYLDPHDPYEPPEEFAQMFSGNLSRPYTAEVLQKINKYDGEIRYLDTELGKLFSHLKSKNLWDDTILVVLADHGEQFDEHGHTGHGFKLFNEEIHVPLFVKFGGSAREIPYTVSSVDVFPTILELSGLPVPTHVQGVSLANEVELKRRAGVLSEIHRKYHWRSITDIDRNQLIFDFDSKSDKPKVEGLYNGVKDYHGLNAIKDSAVEDKLGRDFEALFTAVKQKQMGGGQMEVSSETLEELKSLGYLK